MAIDYLRQYAKQTPVEAPPSLPLATGKSTIEQLLDGQLVAGAGGACFVTESAWEGDFRHGLHSLGDVHGVSPDQLALLSRDPELRFAEARRAVFLDTETTGLSTGAGTYVFLVGAGFFDGHAFRVRQFFLRSPGEERVFLETLADFLSGFGLLITFNGKAFDWPLLESRFVRLRDPRVTTLVDPPHVDLLHSARRLWKRRLASCALQSLEGAVLDVRRSEIDVPGWLIPSLYFQYLRTGNGHELRRVFYHNSVDILSLATLFVHASRVMSDPLCDLVQHGLDLVSIGRLYERSGEADIAVSCYEEALRRELPHDARVEVLLRLAAHYRRERRWEPALAAWDRLVDAGGSPAIQGLTERAKYYEHVERDYLEALDDVQRAMRLCDLQDGVTALAFRQELEHRQSRLINRVYKHRSWSRSHA